MKASGNTLHVVLEDITPDTNNDIYNREKVVVELNQFMNTWNPYVEPKEVMMKSEKKFMRNQIRKAMRYAASLPKLKARNNIYLKLQEVEKKYKNE